MIAEIGHIALALALATALAQAVLPLWGAQRGHAPWMAVARPAALAQFAWLVLAWACLTHAFVTHDFSVALAAGHSNSGLPLVYRITAVWGNHEGSILLWSLVLAGWTLAVALAARPSGPLTPSLAARTLGVLGLVQCGLLLFTLFTSNPFWRLWPAPPDGQDLNPMLQDPGMIIHPPMLYMGYVGLAVPFALCVATLLEARTGREADGHLWAATARWARPWTLLAWCFLTCGIALGSFWAYYELGWGGWWFWDPVENASFMPWLVATALLHSLSVAARRGTLAAWTVLLAIAAFGLSLLGTFIVRSGVLSSVHAFASDPARGVFILCLLALVVGGALAVFAWRAPAFAQASTQPSSAADTPPAAPVLTREASLVANNVLLLVATAAVLLGTLYPLVIDALGLGKLSVGAPYFNAVFVPLMAPAVFLMGVGPLLRWRSTAAQGAAGAGAGAGLARSLRWAAAVSVASALALCAALGHWTPLAALGWLMAAWVVCATVAGMVGRLRMQPRQGAGWWGMNVAHLGVAVFIAGVTAVGSLQSEVDVRVEPGQTVTVAGYRVTLVEVQAQRGPNYSALRARMHVHDAGHDSLARAADAAPPLTVLLPERRVYDASRMPMTEVAIDRGLMRDLYVALGEPVGAGAWGVRVHHKPLVNWIWLGTLLMALGGVLAAASARAALRARRATPTPTPSPTPTPTPQPLADAPLRPVDAAPLAGAAR